jgi:hypothetical protein
LIILLIRPASCQFDCSVETIFHDRLVDERAVVVHVQTQNGKKQFGPDRLHGFSHQRLFSNHYSRALGPAGSDIGQHQAVNVAASDRLSAVRHEIHLEEARGWIIPVAERSHGNAVS